MTKIYCQGEGGTIKAIAVVHIRERSSGGGSSPVFARAADDNLIMTNGN